MTATTPSTLPSHEVERNLRASQRDGNWNAISAGLTASYTTPFALALGASHTTIAFLASFPDLVNSSSQLFASHILKVCHSRRNVVWAICLAQVVAWFSFVVIPLTGSLGIPLLISLVAVNSILNGLQYPIWNSLMGDIVPANKRGYFFARRTRMIGLCSFGAMVLAGSVLAAWKGGPLWGFAALFASAGCARFFSGRHLKEMTDVPLDRSQQPDLTTSAFIQKLVNRSSFGRFVLYASFMKFAVSIANPFFAVFMLQELKLNYLQFTIIAAAPVVGRFLFTPLWGRFVDSRGNKLVLTLTGICAPVVPFLWLLNQDVPYLLLVELFSGFVWSGFDLSSSNYIFDAIKPKNRVKAVGYYNLLVGKGIFLGATLGGFLLPRLPHWFGSSFLAIIAVSAIARLLVAIVLLPRIQEVRLIEVPMKRGFLPLAIRPSESLDYTFIDVSVPEPVPSVQELTRIHAKPKAPLPDWAHSTIGKAILAYNRDGGRSTYGNSDTEVLDLIRKGRLRIPSTLSSKNK